MYIYDNISLKYFKYEYIHRQICRTTKTDNLCTNYYSETGTYDKKMYKILYRQTDQ